ncbi:MAG TPA: serine/threonine-protein kinase [Polyangiaceae bacterium]|nr:serine/threonine-protein kinase [Polyangiaceae bacterium]
MKNETAPAPSPTSPPPGDDRYIGTTLASRYQIVRKLAEGAQARVYIARHTRIGRHVAVKVLLPALATDRDLVNRFLNEGRAVGTLGHPNIVEFIDMGVAPDGLPYLVMEMLEGASLAYEISRAGPFNPGRAAYIGAQIASAVSLANQRGIVHRDLKPENVFLAESGERPDHVKVLDFGISKIAGAGTFMGSAQARVLGTPGFMAPEQLENPSNVDARADVYSLGATLYDMLTGAPPYAEVDFLKLLRAIATEKPRRLDELRSGLPPGLVAVVERAMSKSPADRFQTMFDFEQALLPFVVEPLRRKSEPAPSPRPTFSRRPPSMLLIEGLPSRELPAASKAPLAAPKAPLAAPKAPGLPPARSAPARPAAISAVASRALLAKANKAAVRVSDVTPRLARPNPPPPRKPKPAPGAGAYWLHALVVAAVTAGGGIAALRWASAPRAVPIRSIGLSLAPPTQAPLQAKASLEPPAPPESQAAPRPELPATAPKAAAAPEGRPADEPSPPAPPPPKARLASHARGRSQPRWAPTTPNAPSAADPSAPANPAETAPPAAPTTNAPAIATATNALATATGAPATATGAPANAAAAGAPTNATGAPANAAAANAPANATGAPANAAATNAPANAVSAGAPARAAPRAAGDCDPPYYYEGAKKLSKPGCL